MPRNKLLVYFVKYLFTYLYVRVPACLRTPHMCTQPQGPQGADLFELKLQAAVNQCGC